MLKHSNVTRRKTADSMLQSAALTLLCALVWPAAHAQQPAQQPGQAQGTRITPAFRDSDISQVVEAVAAVTGKTMIVDPRVRGVQITIHSSTSMSPQEFYETFLSILQVYGFAAVESGNIVKIVPEVTARQLPANDLPDRVSATSDEIVTQVVPLRNISAGQLIPALRPMVAQSGHLAPLQSSNQLIITDRASNVARIMRIIQRIDQAGDTDIDVIPLENASATEMVRTINALFTGPGAQPADAVQGVKPVPDDRTNSVILTGERSQRLRVKALITDLDRPREGGGDTEVMYLRYADAKLLADLLKGQAQSIAQAQSAPGAPAAPAAASSNAAIDRNTSVLPDEQNNALIITASPKIMKQIKSIVEKLDIPRLQVQVQAIFAEIVATKAAELGVNWAIDGSGSSDNTVPVGTFNQPVGNASIGSIAAAIDDPETLATTGLPLGLTLGAGRFGDTGTNFAVLLRALRNDSNTNIIQEPFAVTLDNQETVLTVAQEVPFVTGQFTNTGGGNNGSVNPFQTIQREEVGTILKITPQINEGSSVMLKLEVEQSSLAQGVQGASDLVTNKRTITTTVQVEDGGIAVLGGLISDQANEGESRVPLLGSIPLIGELFKTRNGSKEKRSLMIFIRPTILRNGDALAMEANAKYNVLRNQQLARRKGKVTLLPGERQPLLPPIEELSKYADPTAGAHKPAPGTNPQEVSPAQTTPLPPTEAPAPPRDVPPPPRPEDLRPQAR